MPLPSADTSSRPEMTSPDDEQDLTERPESTRPTRLKHPAEPVAAGGPESTDSEVGAVSQSSSTQVPDDKAPAEADQSEDDPDGAISDGASTDAS